MDSNDITAQLAKIKFEVNASYNATTVCIINGMFYRYITHDKNNTSVPNQSSYLTMSTWHLKQKYSVDLLT
jgi:hypothetical protein